MTDPVTPDIQGEPCTKRRLMFACADSYEPDVASLARSPRWIGVPQRIGYTPGSIDGALVGRSERGLVVAFRGTVPPDFEDNYDGWQVFRDWLNDLNCPCVSVAGYPGKVHQGFAGSLQHLRNDGLDEAVTALVAAHPGERLFLTGHSKGAALANLFAWRIHRTLPAGTGLKVVTFAGPRPGDAVFARAYRDAEIASVRYEAAFDVVPQVPLSATTDPRVRAILAVLAPGLPSFDYAAVGTPMQSGPGWGKTVIGAFRSRLSALFTNRLDPVVPHEPFALSRHIFAAHSIRRDTDYDKYVCRGEAGCEAGGHVI